MLTSAWMRTIRTIGVSAMLLMLCASLAAPGAASAAVPRMTFPFDPTITGDAVVGGTVTCHPGAWFNSPTSYTYAWKQQGTTVATGPTYTLTVADARGYIACVVRAANASGETPALADIYVRAHPLAPHARSIPYLSGDFATGSTLACRAPEYRGEVSTLTYAFSSAAGGRTASADSTYVMRAGDLAGPVTCTVAVSNGYGSFSDDSNALRSPSVPSTGPQYVSGMGITGSGKVGSMLTCNAGTWTGATSFSYSWTRDYSPLGVTSQQYTPVVADQGAQLDCRITITGPGGVDIREPGITVIPGDGAPTNTVAPSINGSVTPGSTLTCNAGTWPGATSYRYGWITDLSGDIEPYSTTATLVLTGDSYPGRSVRCVVAGGNASGFATATATSAPVTIPPAAGAPTNSVAPSVTGTPQVGSTITCNPGTWTGATGFNYRWIREDGSGFGAYTDTIAVSSLPGGLKIRCLVNAAGATAAHTVASPLITILDGVAPTKVTSPNISGTGFVGDPLTCVGGSFTGSPTPRTDMSWRVTGFEQVDGAYGPYDEYDMFIPTEAHLARTVTCQQTASNGTQPLAFGSSNGIVVQPRPKMPVIAPPTSIPDIPRVPATPVPPLIQPTPTTPAPKPSGPTPGRDRLLGTNKPDKIGGLAGNDYIHGRGGNDHIVGGAGDDDLRGGLGNDILTGGPGRDAIDGGPGNDRILVSNDRAARDKVVCGIGNDTVIADRGDIVATNCEHVLRRR